MQRAAKPCIEYAGEGTACCSNVAASKVCRQSSSHMPCTACCRHVPPHAFVHALIPSEFLQPAKPATPKGTAKGSFLLAYYTVRVVATFEAIIDSC